MTDITQKAKIIKVEPHTLILEIERPSACGSCALRGRCGSGECRNTVCSFSVRETSSFKEGETIDLFISETNGFRAVFWSCLLPLLLTVATLAALLHFGYGEIKSGICSIIVLIPYYFGLSLFHKFFQKNLPVRINRHPEI